MTNDQYEKHKRAEAIRSQAVFSFDLSGNEIACVNAQGFIARPAIGMGYSNQWRFVGMDKLTRNGSKMVYSHADIVRMVSEMPSAERDKALNGLHVRDFDHGTIRVHGRAARIYRG